MMAHIRLHKEAGDQVPDWLLNRQEEPDDS
jgi:hypothetical protein